MAGDGAASTKIASCEGGLYVERQHISRWHFHPVNLGGLQGGGRDQDSTLSDSVLQACRAAAKIQIDSCQIPWHVNVGRWLAGRQQERLALEAGFEAAVHYELAFGIMGCLVARTPQR